jgi:hypothetical protein
MPEESTGLSGRHVGKATQERFPSPIFVAVSEACTQRDAALLTIGHKKAANTRQTLAFSLFHEPGFAEGVHESL